MKAQDRSNYLIAAAVIVCSLVLLGALTFALTGFAWRPGGRTVALEFHDATGIKLNSAVKYAGKNAGTVRAIRYLTADERMRANDPENAVRVTVQLQQDVPPLLEGVRAALSAETLLGEKFIALMPGAPQGRPLPEGAVIQGATLASIDAVADAAKDALGKVDDILANFKRDYPSLIPRLADLLDQGSSILGQGSNLVSSADSAVQNANGAITQLKTDYKELVPKLNALFAQAQQIATNADHAVLKIASLVERVDAVVEKNESDLSKLVSELRVASQNLKVVTTYAKVLTATLAEKPSTVVWGRKKKQLPDEKTILESKEPVTAE